jgi:hyaluronoglucosaminidase
MTPLQFIMRSCVLAAAATSLAFACPLGDCEGHETPSSQPVAGEGNGTPIYAGLTGSHAARVDYGGTSVIPGRVVVMLEHQAGQYPRFQRNRTFFGGLPQQANMSAHLAEFARDVNRQIPDPNFDGFVVIDYETWKPFWNTTWTNRDLYREESMRYVRSRFPMMPAAQVEALAREEFETAAREFMLTTLREGKRLRPNAKWGYYAYIPGYHGDTDDAEQSDDLSWLWNEVDAMYPSVYVRNFSRPGITRARGEWNISDFRAIVREKIDAAQSVGAGKPMLAFVHRAYKMNNPIYGGQMLNDLDWEASFVYTAELGVDGLILWDAVNSMAAKRSIEQDLRTGQLSERIANAEVFSGGSATVGVSPERRRAGDQ